MYDIFGEFDSVEELNAAAQGQKEQGDKESFFTLAKENGIDKMAAEAYWNEEMEEFTDFFSAAVGKLEVEKVSMKNQNMPVEPIVDYLTSQCMDETFARIIRNKGKSLNKCIVNIENRCKEECKRVNNNPKGAVAFQVADMTVFEWARAYYVKAK